MKISSREFQRGFLLDGLCGSILEMVSYLLDTQVDESQVRGRLKAWSLRKSEIRPSRLWTLIFYNVRFSGVFESRFSNNSGSQEEFSKSGRRNFARILTNFHLVLWHWGNPPADRGKNSFATQVDYSTLDSNFKKQNQSTNGFCIISSSLWIRLCQLVLPWNHIRR